MCGKVHKCQNELYRRPQICSRCWVYRLRPMGPPIHSTCIVATSTSIPNWQSDHSGPESVAPVVHPIEMPDDESRAEHYVFIEHRWSVEMVLVSKEWES